MEKETLGVYISGHPLAEYKDVLENMTTTLDLQSLNHIDEEAISSDIYLNDGARVQIGGIVVEHKRKATRNNNMMAFVTLEDLYGTVEIIVFPTVYKKYSKLLELDKTVIVDGKISLKEEEEPKIICDSVRPLARKQSKKLYLKISKGSSVDIGSDICTVLQKYRGNIPVYLYIEDTNEKKLAHREFWVDENNELISELSNVLGKECVKLIG